jgi:transposase InsO family protein
MCKVLKIARSTFYYESQTSVVTDQTAQAIVAIFKESKNNYGTRKIKEELRKLDFTVSRRKIGRIMRAHGLVSTYTVAQFKVHKDTCNESPVANELNRQFDNQEPLAVVVSDLTYVRVNHKWNYICVLIDLFNREIIGYSTGIYKDAPLVYRAFASIKTNLKNICLFHTDRGNEFKNKLIEEVLQTFEIKRSLSMKGCPYDNAVAEATFKIIKTEFVRNYHFESLSKLNQKLTCYVQWFNSKRIHSTLGYLSPLEYKFAHLKITV